MGLVFDYTECLLLPGVATTLSLGKFLDTESELFKKLVNESNVSIFQKNTESGSNYVFSGRFADLTVANTIIVNFIDDLRTKINEVHTSLLFDSNISKIGSVINNPGSTHTQLIKEESETENMTRVTIHPLEENVHSENMESVQIETMESVQIENTENVQIENQGSKKRETKNELRITQQEHDKCRKKENYR
ncbi:unnamed protein product [Mytilus edulis]|uniref:Uncharacterized protein n=1 Tax=Mytilus edulis TaxID=6550 RepID=A0A8S3R200_MYTED|nr:unnamed protein product [Mytilus edulis]